MSTAVSESDHKIRQIRKTMRERGVDVSRADAILMMSLNDLVREFERFMFEDLMFSRDDKEISYKSELTLSEFYKRKHEITRRIIDIAMLLKISRPHLKSLHMDIPKVFREALDEISIEGKKPYIFKLYNKILAYAYEIESAIASGRSTSLLETIDIEFLDTHKIYSSALRNLKKDDWLAFVVLQLIVRHSGGQFISAKEISAKTSLSETSIRSAMNVLFEKCKEIINVDQRRTEKLIQIPPIYAKYELLKM